MSTRPLKDSARALLPPPRDQAPEVGLQVAWSEGPIVDPTLLGYFTLMENVGPRSGFVIVEAVGPRPLYHCAAPPELSAGCRGALRRGTRLPRSGSKSLGRRSTDCRPDLARLFYTDGKRRPEVGLRYSGSGRPPAVVPLRSAARALCGAPRCPPPRDQAPEVGLQVAWSEVDRLSTRPC